MRQIVLIACLVAPLLAAAPAAAQDRFIGEVFMSAGTYCPRGSLPADGRTLQVQSNMALFSLVGTTYGGDGRTTFALPDLVGRSPIGAAARPGRPTLGDAVGGAAVVVRDPDTVELTKRGPENPGVYALDEPLEHPDGADPALESAPQGPLAGAGLALTYCVATVGIFPSQP